MGKAFALSILRHIPAIFFELEKSEIRFALRIFNSIRLVSAF